MTLTVPTLTNLRHTEEEIAAFLDGLAQDYYYAGPERRSHPRYTMAIVVEVQPWDEGLQPQGPSFQGITRDLSIVGLGLFTTHVLTTKFSIVELRNRWGDTFQVLVEVLRCDPCGDEFFEVGARYVLDPRALAM